MESWSRNWFLVLTAAFSVAPVAYAGPPSGVHENHLSLAWENDLYFKQDFYYTNGFQVEFFHHWLKRSPFNWILLGHGTGADEPGTVMPGLQLRQEIYTPADLAADSISRGDHPYCSTLTLSQVEVVNFPERNLRIESGIRLGVLGPAALGFRTQELAHLVSNPSRPPLGWEYQVRNDLVLNYHVVAEKSLVRSETFPFGVVAKGRLGTLHTDLEGGFWFRMDARQGYFQRFGPSGEPGVNVAFHVSATARYVFYDATLQGGLFNRSSPYFLTADEVNRWVGKLNATAILELRNHQLVVRALMVTPRFRMAVPHGWMGIGYSYWF